MKRKQVNEEEGEEEEEEGTSETQAVRDFEIFLIEITHKISARAASSSTSNFLTQTLT